MPSPIILLVGQAGAGKDTAAGILVKNFNAVAIAHADPMKRFAAAVFGFTEQQLWGPSEHRNAVDDRYYSDDAWAHARLRIQDHGPAWCRDVFHSTQPMPAVLAWFDGLRREMRGPRPSEPVPGAHWLSISGGYVLVDEADLSTVAKYSWRLKEDLARGTRYAVTDIGDHTIRMHRLLMNPPPAKVVDHINGYGLDNRRTNLRLATHSQNHGNQEKRKISRSTSKGVTFDIARDKWSAKLVVNYKVRNLGRFDTEFEAASAYRKAALRVFGEYAIQQSRFGLTPRLVLQTMGTELGRAISKNVWVDYALNVASQLLAGGCRYSRDCGILATTQEGPDYVVLTDGRFRNELVSVKCLGGAVLDICAPDTNGSEAEQAGVAGHASEKEQRSIPKHWFDATIVNDKRFGISSLELTLKEVMGYVYDRVGCRFEALETTIDRVSSSAG